MDPMAELYGTEIQSELKYRFALTHSVLAVHIVQVIAQLYAGFRTMPNVVRITTLATTPCPHPLPCTMRSKSQTFGVHPCFADQRQQLLWAQNFVNPDTDVLQECTVVISLRVPLLGLSLEEHVFAAKAIASPRRFEGRTLHTRLSFQGTMLLTLRKRGM